MSKYKSFASQGSFRDNQLKAPNESEKTLRAASRQIQGMDAAQAFLQRNEEIYLRAQRNAQSAERMNREDNFKMETENRKIYQQSLRRNNEIALENDRRQSAQAENFYKDLSSFSKTAFELYGTFETQRKKQRQALATQEVIKSGLDYNQIGQLYSIDQKLTDSAFRQTEFIQKLRESGASEDRINIIANMWRRNAPNLYLNTQAAYQQSFTSYVPGLNKAIEDLGPDATPEQIRSRIQTFKSEFIINKLPGARPEMLETSGLLRSMQSFENQMISSYTRQAIEKNREDIKIRFKDNLQTTFVKEGVAGVMRVLQTEPSRWKREEFTDWVSSSLKGSGPYSLTPDEGLEILSYPLMVGEQQTSISKQFSFEAGKINEAVRAARSRVVSEFNLSEAENKLQSEATLAQMVDKFAVDGDGRIDSTELEVLRERAISLGIPNSEVLNYAQQNSVNARTDRAIERVMMEKADNLNLKVDDVMSVKMGANLRNKLLNIARQQQETRQSPIYKSHIKSIEAALSQDARIKAAPITGASNYSVILMQDRYKQQYKQNLKRLDSPDEALALTLQQIKTMQAVPGAITKQGTYKEIEDQIKASSEGARVSLNRVNSILAAMSTKVFDTDPEWAVGVVGEKVFNNFYSTLQAGGQPPELLKTLAARRGVDPLTLINHLATGAKKPPIKPLDNQLKELKDSLPPITRRLYDTYRTNERVTRANSVVSNATSQMPKRSNFSGNEDYLRFRRAIIKQESGGNYQIVNPDSGAIGIGQVMPENVGPWTERYLGKRLTPEQFRYNNAAQDAVINGRFKDMLADQAKAGYSGEEMVRRAAAVWYSGQANLWNYNKPEYYNGRRYPSIAEYTKSIWNSFQRQ